MQCKYHCSQPPHTPCIQQQDSKSLSRPSPFSRGCRGPLILMSDGRPGIGSPLSTFFVASTGRVASYCNFQVMAWLMSAEKEEGATTSEDLMSTFPWQRTNYAQSRCYLRGECFGSSLGEGEHYSHVADETQRQTLRLGGKPQEKTCGLVKTEHQRRR